MNIKSSLFYRTIIIVLTSIGSIVILTLFLASLSNVNAAVVEQPYDNNVLNDINSERWKIFADMEKTRGDPGVVGLNGKVHVMGGYFPTGFGYNQTHEVFDPLSNTWQYKANLPVGSSDMMVAAVGNELYAIGGWNVNLGGAIGFNYRYDPSLNNWITKTAMITPVSGAGVVVLTDTIHILGGYTGSEILSDVQIYDPVTELWTPGTSMLIQRAEFGAALLNGKIYAIGGVTAGGITTNTVEIYDPVADLWTSGPPLPESRASMAVVVRQGEIYVAGGTDNWSGGAPQRTAFVLDPVLGTWSAVNPMPTSRYAAEGAVISDTIYVIGGVGDPGASTANEGFGFLPIASTITIDSDDPDPSRIYQPFTIGYSVTAIGEIPTGVVTVTVANRPERCIGALANGLGSCDLAIDALGMYTLTATYSGNHILLGSSDTEVHVVERFKQFLPLTLRD